MKIYISKGSGTGPTPLAAFDAALNSTGIANYNLIHLSSVVPPRSEIVVSAAAIPAEVMPGTWGDRLYVVMAEDRIDTPGKQIWAGVGWVQERGTNKGLFVEHTGDSEESVRTQIRLSLQALMDTRGVDFGEINMQLHGAECIDEPTCAMVVAVYQASDWNNIAYLPGL